MPKAITPRVDALVAQVNAFCESKHGLKTELAAHLQVSKQHLHPFLKGEKEPGGEKVLAMLEWMELHGQTVQPAAATT